jgi:bisphosphoglycerate-dependent phosphoglycerate mutase
MWVKGKDPKFPDGESTQDVIKRLNSFLNNELKLKNLITNKNILILTHNVVLRTLIGSKFNIDMKDWFKININYFDSIEFKLEKNKLRPNISRMKFLDIFDNLYFNY